MAGKVEKANTGALKANLFPKRDINKDGVLSGTEVGKLKKLDGDGDGKIDKEEFDAGLKAERDKLKDQAAQERFSRLVINDDSVLTGTEATRFPHRDSPIPPAFRAGRPARPPAPGAPPAPVAQDFAGSPPPAGNVPSAFDFDREFMAARSQDWQARLEEIAERKFAKADLNKDDALNGTEVADNGTRVM